MVLDLAVTLMLLLIIFLFLTIGIVILTTSSELKQYVTSFDGAMTTLQSYMIATAFFTGMFLAVYLRLAECEWHRSQSPDYAVALVCFPMVIVAFNHLLSRFVALVEEVKRLKTETIETAKEAEEIADVEKREQKAVEAAELKKREEEESQAELKRKKKKSEAEETDEDGEYGNRVNPRRKGSVSFATVAEAVQQGRDQVGQHRQAGKIPQFEAKKRDDGARRE